MAKLSTTQYAFKAKEGDWDGQTAEFQALVAVSNSLGPDKVLGGVVSFPIADGKAHYLVTSATPLTLQHIPYMDGYSVHPAMLRGLTLKDVRANIAQAQAFQALWEHRKTQPEGLTK